MRQTNRTLPGSTSRLELTTLMARVESSNRLRPVEMAVKREFKAGTPVELERSSRGDTKVHESR